MGHAEHIMHIRNTGGVKISDVGKLGYSPQVPEHPGHVRDISSVGFHAPRIDFAGLKHPGRIGRAGEFNAAKINGVHIRQTGKH